MSQKGVFIAVESPLADFADRHCEQLKQRLEAAGYEVAYFSFPRADQPSSYFANRYTNGEYGLTNQVVPYAGSLFYALDHFEAGHAIRQALQDGKVVLAHKYLGANMVEQGAKLTHPEERRGYFLWLDNLESQVLNAPRPAKSFILSLSNNHPDIVGEAESLAAPLDVQIPLYKELCDLYPKDFVRIDTERSGKSMNDAAVQDILWGLVEPLLPITETTSTSATGNFKLSHHTAQTVAPYRLELQISQLLIGQLLGSLHATYQLEMGNDISYLTPSYFDDSLKTNYQATMDQLIANYEQLQHGLSGRGSAGISDDAAQQLANNLLPLASLRSLQLQLTTAELEAVLTMLLSNEQPEAWALGQQLLKACRQQATDIEIKVDSIAYRGSRQRSLRKVAQQLPHVHASQEAPTASLISVSPRNEFELLAAMLYPFSDRPYNTVEQAIKQWSFEQKQAVFEAYFANRPAKTSQADSALSAASYVWDMHCPYQHLLELLTYMPLPINQQTLTPRFGYDVPESVESAGLTEVYQDSFDRSMQLYSDLQQAGYELEAQYVTLFGHKQRWQLTTDGRQLAQLVASDQPLAAALRTTLAEEHPTLAELLTSSVSVKPTKLQKSKR